MKNRKLHKKYIEQQMNSALVDDCVELFDCINRFTVGAIQKINQGESPVQVDLSEGTNLVIPEDLDPIKIVIRPANGENSESIKARLIQNLGENPSSEDIDGIDMMFSENKELAKFKATVKKATGRVTEAVKSGLERFSKPGAIVQKAKNSGAWKEVAELGNRIKRSFFSKQ